MYPQSRQGPAARGTIWSTSSVGGFTLTPQQERDVIAFLLAFPGDVVPAVGATLTLTATDRDAPAIRLRLDTLLAAAAQGTCDVVASGRVGDAPRSLRDDPAVDRRQARVRCAD